MTLRGRSFGIAASLYDKVRPGYPLGLISDISALLPGPEVLEIGAGTGKATRMLIDCGLRPTCIEPDPEMGFILTAKCGVHPVVSSFEEWEPDREFDGVLCAQAWHWIDPTVRLPKASKSLRPGGLLALFWNHAERIEGALDLQVSDVYMKLGLDPADRPMTLDPWPGNEIDEFESINFIGKRSYEWTEEYSGFGYIEYLNSTSHMLVMSEAARQRLNTGLTEIMRGVETLRVTRNSQLYLGRRA